MMTLGFKHTRIACYTGYITQAIVNNFLPLLFVTFQKEYGISLDKIALLVSMNFGMQLLIDAVAAKYVDRIGYRRAMVWAHIFAGVGMVLLAVLPNIITPFAGIVIAVMVYAIGGGLIEVVVSPVIEACPSDDKKGAMSLLHSFYCWGVMGVTLVSTVFFSIAGIKAWPYLAAMLALIPLANSLFFSKVPLATLVEDNQGMGFKKLFKTPLFWLFFVMMICSGAAEQSVSQWASAFAENGLRVDKWLGDLLGPCAFALTMGLARMLHTSLSKKVGLKVFMTISTMLCLFSYMLLVLNASPVWGLIGCALCGFSVGIMWPGTFSLASGRLPLGGTVMFGLLALGGDIGCATGPGVVGLVSGRFQDQLSAGFLVAMIFPVLLLVGIVLLYRAKVRH